MRIRIGNSELRLKGASSVCSGGYTIDLVNPTKFRERVFKSVFEASPKQDGRLGDLLSNFKSQPKLLTQNILNSPTEINRFKHTESIIERRKNRQTRKNQLSYNSILSKRENKSVRELSEAEKKQNSYFIYPINNSINIFNTVESSEQPSSIRDSPKNRENIGFNLPNSISWNKLKETLPRENNDILKPKERSKLNRLGLRQTNSRILRPKEENIGEITNYQERIAEWGEKLRAQYEMEESFAHRDQASSDKMQEILSESKMNIKDRGQMERIKGEIEGGHRKVAARKVDLHQSHSRGQTMAKFVQKWYNGREADMKARKMPNLPNYQNIRLRGERSKVNIDKYNKEKMAKRFTDFHIRPLGGQNPTFTENDNIYAAGIKRVKLRKRDPKANQISRESTPDLKETQKIVDRQLNLLDEKLSSIQSTHNTQLNYIKTQNKMLTFITNKMSHDINLNKIFMEALRSGNHPKVEMLILTYPELIKTTFYMNQTALHIAVKKGFLRIVEFLVENGANPRMVDLLNRNCFQVAQKYKNKEIMKYFRTKFGHEFPELE